MTATPYPLPRETRESTILVGNGTAGPYGPSTFKIFDTADLVVLMRKVGEDRFSDVTLDAVATKSTGAALDTFSVTFVDPVLATTDFVLQSRRIHERDTAVTKGGAMSANELEKELSKQGSTLEELRRDVDRGLAFQPDYDGDARLPLPAPGQAIGWSADGKRLENKSELGSGTPVPALENRYLRTNASGLLDVVGVDESARLDIFASGAAPSRAFLGTTVNVPTRTALKALDTTKDTSAFLTEIGREGAFVWRSGDYSTQIAADPLEGIYLKADAVAATAGAWVRQAGFHITGVDIRWFGAVPIGDPSATTTAIQRAMNLAATIGAGRVGIPRGEWRLGKTTTEAYQTSAMPVGQQDQYSLLVPSGVILEGEGYLTLLKRYVAAPLVVVLLASTVGSQVRDLRINGNDTMFPYVGDTYGSGGGLFVESSTGAEDRMNTLDTLWIEDTPGYGIGVEWGHHRGLTIQNIAIDGTGSDGIDIKRMDNGNFDAKAIVLNNIKVTNFGRSATDVASQAGIDIRGWVTASNVHVYGAWGTKASSGIRFHDTGGGVIGGHHASVTNFFIERTSGGVAQTYGAHNNGGEAAAFLSGVAMGCSYNFYSSAKAGLFVDCRGKDPSVWNYFIATLATNTQLIGCSSRGGTRGFYIQGGRTTLINPVCEDHTSAIEATASATNTQIVAPVFVNMSAAEIVDAGTNTTVLRNGKMGVGNDTVLEIAKTVGGTGWISILRDVGQAGIVAVGTGADIDLVLSTKGNGYHALGGAKTQTTVGAAGGASAVPATPTGYLQIKIAGTIRKIPFYAN